MKGPVPWRRRSRGGAGPARERAVAGTALLRAESLVVRYGGVLALDGVSLSVAAGEVVGLVGANGAGKTTLLDCLSGHLRPLSGRMWLGARELGWSAPARRARWGMIRSFQDSRLFPTMPVSDALLLASAEQVAPELAPVSDRLIGELSTGQRKHLDLVCALARHPKVLLLDEPSAGLATAELPPLEARIRVAVDTSGAGVVMVEHDLALVWRLADRVVVLEAGKVVADGPPAELRGHPALAFGRLM
jgi:ABC-type branched-subunit amino acid transport system ATPase component